MPLFSNLEPAGRLEAIIFPARLNLRSLGLIQRLKEFFRKFGPEGFALLPIQRRNGQMSLPMAECMRLGIPRWSDLPSHYFSELLY